MAAVPSPLPTAFSAVESSPIDGPPGSPWAQLVQTWSLIAQQAGLGPPAIRAELGADFPLEARVLPSPAGDVLLHHGGGEWWFKFLDGLACRIAPGTPPVVAVDNLNNTSLDQFTRIAGPITAMLMDTCGFYPLHACGVMLGSRIFAVHGQSGSGKSTLAAMLAASGIPVAGDDLLPLDGAGNIIGVNGALRILPTHAPPGWQPSAYLPDGRGWYGLPPLPTLPIAGLLLLERGPGLHVESIRGADRLLAILRSGYLSHMDPSPAPAWHERVVKAAGQVDIFRLVVPGTINALLDSRERLTSCLESLGG